MKVIDRVGVVGCGLMGAGIAEVAARKGIDVVVTEADADALGRGRARIESSLARALKASKITEEEL
ncbi:MAG: 3-hydroxyacyl-CoA dehydrogenase NAD-binding domain-containing protein, partial [Actinomycetota bacterium]|nr:3-hydroxyacyl-CoA dehydrogenase NAD-binding domain-containing protein [Actinomycetota bacterium]